MISSEKVEIVVSISLLNSLLFMLFRNRMFMVMVVIIRNVFMFGFNSSSELINVMVMFIGRKFLCMFCI